jgi:hypothetical protein
MAMLISAALVAAGGVLAFLTIRNPAADEAARGPEPTLHCPLSAPGLSGGAYARTSGMTTSSTTETR